MSLANSYSRLLRLHAIPAPDRGATRAQRDSDAWPDWSTELDASDLAKASEKNKAFTVLREATGAILYSVGLVVLLMAILSALHIR